jgi:hypothetical protein
VSVSEPNKTGFALLVAGFAAGLLFWVVAQSLYRNALNYDLSEAVSRRDIPRIEQLLDRGADPDAPWSGYGWRDSLDRMTHRTTIFDHYSILDRTAKDPPIHRLLLRHHAGAGSR